MDRSGATCLKGATGREHQMESPKTARVFASVFSMGVPVTVGRRRRPTETMRSIGRSPTERRQRGSQPDERGIRQGIAQVAGEAVGHLAGLSIDLAAEAILVAVRFIRDHDNVLPRAQLGHRFTFFRHEFVYGGEHHAAARPVQQLAQMLAPAGLHRCLAEDVMAALELAEKLVVEVVEVVAVGQHHERRVLHRGLADHAGGEEEHGEALAAALRVPDHARATVIAARQSMR